jgi:centromeric protein E
LLIKGAEGLRLKEGGHINKSLLTLASCIQKLSENTRKGEKGHIPFRDSKLTRILSNGTYYLLTLLTLSLLLSIKALGGNGKTAIICTVNPLYLDETLTTLKFAQRAKTVHNAPVLNKVAFSLSDGERYRERCRALEERVKALEMMLNEKNQDVSTETISIEDFAEKSEERNSTAEKRSHELTVHSLRIQ